MDSWQWTIDNG